MQTKITILLLFLFFASSVQLYAQPYCCQEFVQDFEVLYANCQYKTILRKIDGMLNGCDGCQSDASRWLNKAQACLDNPNAPSCPCSQPPPNNCSIIEMVYVQGGTFQMGCTPEQGGGCGDDENPSHSVTLGNYYIGKYEVTQKQWREIMGSSPSYFQNCDNCPVEQVSWDDVQEFLRKLNQKYPGCGYRLPTEAEWEYAARGGSKRDGTKYAGSNSLDNVGWYDSNSGGKTHPVGQKVPNGLGIYDMSGNVWEWCSDYYDEYYYQKTQNSNNPKSEINLKARVLRGGSWDLSPYYCRVSSRDRFNPTGRYFNFFGFRLVR